jgi:hypothetical protein
VDQWELFASDAAPPAEWGTATSDGRLVTDVGAGEKCSMRRRKAKAGVKVKVVVADIG